MIVVVLSFILLVVIVVVIVTQSRSAPDTDPRLPYLKEEALFSADERAFLGVLDQAAGPRYRVFGKVRIADVVHVHGVKDLGARQAARDRIQAGHFDFVLCDPATLAVLCAVELDDAAHKPSTREGRDDFVAQVCRAAGLPLIRVPARHGYSVEELRAVIDKALEEPSLAADA